jgi:molybdenum cofactor cytidylyltransferase/nicotine blue oxidoreductase
MGTPKGLLRDERQVPFLDRVLGNLFQGGCETVTVVLGACSDEAAGLLAEAGWAGDPAVDVVVCSEGAAGWGASRRAGLQRRARPAGGGPAGSEADAALVMLVDLPDVGSDVLERVLAAGAGEHSLVRATYDGTPGHPVLLGRAHWPGLLASVSGDRGARDYLAGRDVLEVECADLATGADVDRPEDLRR